MTHKKDTSSFGSTTKFCRDNGVLLADRLACEVKRRWRQGEPPDLAAVLAENPEMKRYKSIVLDLACDEYEHRLQAGESLDADEFSKRFPTLQKSLYMLIEIQQLLGQDPDAQGLRDAATWPEPGQPFLGFLLITELGRGTFGRVFLASEPALGNRLVALKVAPQGGEEADMLGKLQHPNIVPVHSVQEDLATGLTAVCMPYLGRATLCDVLDRAFANSRPPRRSRVVLETIRQLGYDSDLPEASSFDRVLREGSYVDGIIHLAAQLADALAYAHSRGICHRDLKPSNVLVSLNGRPLLLDFNLSLDERVCPSRIGGTLPYMAPEQLMSVVLESSEHNRRPDPRSDLFSFGVILHELLAGSLPFGTIHWDRSVKEIAEQLLRQQEKGPQPIRDKNEQVDKPLAQLIDECLEFDPERRPQTADTLAAAFRRQLSPARRGKRWAGNHRRGVSLAVALLMAVLLAGVGFLMLRDPYDVRQFKHGVEYFNQGRYQLAIDYFDGSIRSNPDHHEARFSRGRAYLKLKNFRQAEEDFAELARVAPSAEVYACRGYCLSGLNDHEEAIFCYGKASEMGFSSAALLNNVGFSHGRLARLEDAEVYFNRALEKNEALQAAHHNLVRVFLNRSYAGQSVPESAIAHASRAVELGPPSAELYRDAAALYANVANADSKSIRRALEYLEKAVARGLDPGLLEMDPSFSLLRQRPDFQRLIEKPVSAKPSTEANLLLDPL